MIIFVSKRSFFALIVLTIIVGGTAWVSLKSTQSFVLGEHIPKKLAINTALNVNLDKYGDNGNILYKSNGEKLVHQYDGHIFITGVLMDVFNNKKSQDKNINQNPWKLKSDYADLKQNSDNIFLKGNVTMIRDKFKNSPQIKILTKDVYVNAKTGKFNSKSKIKVLTSENNSNLTGIGFYGSISNPLSININSQVRTYYEK